MSIFQDYPVSITPPLPLSFGVAEALAQVLSDIEEIDQQDFILAVEIAYSKAYPKDQVEKNLDALIRQTIRCIEQDRQRPAVKPNRGSGQTIGSKFVAWLANLDPSQICLYLAEYDIARALDYYWKQDQRLVKEAVLLKNQHDMQNVLTDMEACMYGFGNSYKDDQTSGSHYDLCSGEGLDKLKELGF